MKLCVQVTIDDIVNGKQDEPCECPVALALKRLGYNPTVSTNEVDFKDVNGRLLYSKELPSEVTDFITHYDETGHGDPFSFELDAY